MFSEKYNFQEGRNASTQPEMLARLFEGLVHPLIHVGYGVEFGLKGMITEGMLKAVREHEDYPKLGFQGLALTAVHTVRVRETLPRSLFAPSPTNIVEHTANHLTTSTFGAATNANLSFISRTGGIHVFDVVAHILKDDRFNRRDITDHFTEILAEYSPMVKEHTARWSIDLSQPGEIERKIEELVWLSSLLYGVGGLTSNKFKFDFFLWVASPSAWWRWWW